MPDSSDRGALPALSDGPTGGSPAPAGEPGATLSMRHITKRFFGTTVLDDVSLDCRAGEVHAIVGENGAGKSTLVKILAGVYQPDAGTLLIDGREERFHHPSQALARGVSLVHQEFSLLPERSVAENIFLGREPTRRFAVDRRALGDGAARLLAELGVESIPPRALVGRLPVAQQQTVEIAKALSYRPRILVLDEPTAALAPAEVTALFERVRHLVGRGLTVLYISHRLPEVFDLARRVSVLKDGRLVRTAEVSAVTPGDLVTMMVGREISAHYFPPRATAAGTGAVRLAVHGGSRRRGDAGQRLDGIDLELRAGEIVGVAGLDGSGRSALAYALFGAAPFDTGTVEVGGRPVRLDSPRRAIAAGIGLLSADRKAEGLVLPLRTQDNALLAVRARGRGAARAGRAVLAELAARVGLRPAAMRRESRLLSGGNQQKAVLVKWLATKADVYLFDEPTRGIDVGAKAGIHDHMRELAEAGAAILMFSSELPEVIGMSDRILVMRDGRIAGELPAGAAERDIMALATGQAVAS
jgi:ABC-type sugar transport system ATPase subunit